MDLLFGHELGELRCFAELGEVGVLEEAVAIFEAGVEGAAQIVESEVLSLPASAKSSAMQ